jgi:hypothetical protein
VGKTNPIINEEMKTNSFVQVENLLLIDEKFYLKNSKYLVIFVCVLFCHLLGLLFRVGFIFFLASPRV